MYLPATYVQSSLPNGLTHHDTSTGTSLGSGPTWHTTRPYAWRHVLVPPSSQGSHRAHVGVLLETRKAASRSEALELWGSGAREPAMVRVQGSERCLVRNQPVVKLSRDLLGLLGLVCHFWGMPCSFHHLTLRRDTAALPSSRLAHSNRRHTPDSRPV